MTKQDMIDLIEAYDSLNALNRRIVDLTGGHNIDNEECNGLYKIFDVIWRHSRFEGTFDEEGFEDILESDKSAEEKYELLK